MTHTELSREPAVWRLANGLRVVAVCRPGVGVACVSIAYGVGFRHEQRGQSGFAHLFEHLMTQGSAHLDKLEHKQLIERNGGWYSGQTRHDYTEYTSTVPAGALELALWCEADRMRGLRLSRENLDNQVSVVKQEIRGNILSQPYGGFPYFQVDAALFDTFANNHDGYGDFTDLDRADVEDAELFFDVYYPPGNAVLTVVGDFDESRLRSDIDRLFGPLPLRDAVRPPMLDEPPLAASKLLRRHDPRAGDAAVAFGYRTPQPLREHASYLRLNLLAALLADGPRSRWHRRLIGRDGLAGSVQAELGSIGDWAGTVAPAQLAVGVRHPVDVPVETVVAAVDAEIGRLIDDLGQDEVDRVAAERSGRYLRAMDATFSLAHHAGLAELLYGDAGLAFRPPEIWRSSTAEQLRDLAWRWLADAARVVVALSPEAA